ncbi:tetratricopeptide repeat protein [Synechococcus sp. MU1617]|uniref:tetratricopeptide repeat protein n=1 Tax=Synechococcus sp. MU1617 TaxID=2508346 RepID=UPI001CF8CB80|nr:tetratricopeptide repeat protein [Synechococcus sp. MU1617]MCB4389387.1 tetratricopeptide repeat protein [Synechococcus sp. MU1617]
MAVSSDVLNLFNLGKYHQAISTYSSMPEGDKSPISDSILAACYFKLGEFSEANQLLIKIEPFLSENSEFLTLYASNSRRLGDLEKSENLFKQALDINPQSVEIKNNYANLLLDLNRLDDAYMILQEIVRDNPSYNDAIQNLNRVQFRIEQNKNRSSNPESINKSIISSGYLTSFSLADPLLLAFAENEVNYSSKRYKLSSDAKAQASIIPSTDNLKLEADYFAVLEQSISSGEFEFALKLCSQIVEKHGISSSLYDYLSDIYLNLKRFHESEVCLLHACQLGGISPKRCLNLVSFACMRQDYKLANNYLEQAASIDPSHPQLQAISDLVAKQSNSVLQQTFASSWHVPELKEQ